MKNKLQLLLLSCLLVSGQAIAQEIPPGSQPWGGMESNRMDLAKNARMFEERFAEGLDRLAKIEPAYPEAPKKTAAKNEPVKEEKEELPLPPAKPFDMRNGKDFDVKAGKAIDISSQPAPEIEIIESGGVSDEKWVAPAQKEINDIVQTRRKDTSFFLKKGDNVVFYAVPWMGDAMRLWKDLRVNSDARRLINEGAIKIVVPYETFEDLGPAMVYVWAESRGLGDAFLDWVADLPDGCLVPHTEGMAIRLDGWLKANGSSFPEISGAAAPDRRRMALRLREMSDDWKALLHDEAKLPIYVNGKLSPNYFNAIRTD